MKYGLSDKEFAFLDQRLLLPLKKLGATIYIFGSRARGTQQKFSDVDILVQSSMDLSRVISAIAEELESSNFPLKVDIVQEKDLAESFRASVFADRVRV